MIKRTDAYECSDGSCHKNKQAAYTAEIKVMYQHLPNVGNRQPTAAQFTKLAKVVADWLEQAQLLGRQMKEEPDVETARSIAGQGG